jgi:hypothetical protein
MGDGGRPLHVTGFVLYLLADWADRALGTRAARIFEHWTIVFFILLLSMAQVTFASICRLLQAQAPPYPGIDPDQCELSRCLGSS